MLVLSPAGLHGDEAQYWAWAQELDAGYYSKPPLIAWVIAGTTALFGDAEWAVRLASPFLHTVAATFAFLSARRLFGDRAGFVAAAAYALMPGVTLSSAIISTDALLLAFVSGFVWFWVRLQDGGGMGSAVGLGAMLGLGLLSKYAMVFPLAGLALATLVHAPTRRFVLSAKGLVAGAIAAVIFAPNILWNAANDFATVSHTGDNANMSDGAGLHPGEWLEFFGGQFGVFGPVTFAALLVALVWAVRRGGTVRAISLAVLVPLAVISVQALLSRANANWAAAAYGAAPVVLAGWAVAGRWRMRVVAAGLALNLLLAVVPPLVLTSPQLTDDLGFANSVKRQRGWPETREVIEAELARGNYSAVAVDQRLTFYALNYYGMDEAAPLHIWRFEPSVTNHAELTRALPEGARDVLLASYFFESYEPYFAADFDTLDVIRDVEVQLGGGKVRRLRLYRASGYRGPRERR